MELSKSKIICNWAQPKLFKLENVCKAYAPPPYGIFFNFKHKIQIHARM